MWSHVTQGARIEVKAREVGWGQNEKDLVGCGKKSGLKSSVIFETFDIVTYLQIPGFLAGHRKDQVPGDTKQASSNYNTNNSIVSLTVSVKAAIVTSLFARLTLSTFTFFF